MAAHPDKPCEVYADSDVCISVDSQCLGREVITGRRVYAARRGGAATKVYARWYQTRAGTWRVTVLGEPLLPIEEHWQPGMSVASEDREQSNAGLFLAFWVVVTPLLTFVVWLASHT